MSNYFPGRVAKYCNEYVCVSLLSVCLFVQAGGKMQRLPVNSSQVKSSVTFSSQSQLATMPLYMTVNVTRF